jgi:tRNA nucleotidyltransferase/poly(A) polymerase
MERVNVELVKLFSGKNLVKTLYSMDEYGILELLIPETADIKKIPPNTHHHLNLFDHSIETVKQIQNFYEKSCDEVKKHLDKPFSGGQKRLAYLKIAAFLHDAGKPKTWYIDPETGRHRFIKHDDEGSKLIVNTLKNLKFSKKQISYIQKMIKYHIYPAAVVTNDTANEKAYLRFYRKMENEVIDLIVLAYGDRMSTLGEEVSPDILEKNIKGLDELLKGFFKQQIAPLPKFLDGREIMDILNIPAGPELGDIIEKLKEAQISSEIATRDEAVEFVKRFAKKS